MPRTDLTYTQDDIGRLIEADVRSRGMQPVGSAFASYQKGDRPWESDYVTFTISAEPAEPHSSNSLGHQIEAVKRGGGPYS